MLLIGAFLSFFSACREKGNGLALTTNEAPAISPMPDGKEEQYPQVYPHQAGTWGVFDG